MFYYENLNVHRTGQELRRTDPFLFIARDSACAITPERIFDFIDFLLESTVICISSDAT
jgi:hypothetical protein